MPGQLSGEKEKPSALREALKLIHAQEKPGAGGEGGVRLASHGRLKGGLSNIRRNSRQNGRNRGSNLFTGLGMNEREFPDGSWDGGA